MNHVFKLVWSRSLGMLIPVPEGSRTVGHGGRRLSQRARRRLARRALQGLGLGALGIIAPAPAFALPTGGSVAGGTASISTNASTLTVNQTSPKAVINWQSFSIGGSETVNFRQPGASSVALNRVLGNDPSQIFGRLAANGQIFLVNPNGVFFAPGAKVDVGGLVASTLAITDKNFLSGNYQFAGASTASVVNYAKIKAFNGGYVAFIGNTVDNEGSISTPGGATALGAGGSVALTIAGNSLVSFQVTTAALNAAVRNGGAIKALNGVVLLTARAKNALLQTVVNNTGVIQADSATSTGGVVTLLGGGGNVAVSGIITASSTAGIGGTVVVSGVNAAVSGTARISATGRTGGGTIAIGGGVHGGGKIFQAVRTSVAAGAVVDASATGSGKGGTVSVWSDVSNPNSVTTVSGSILARGAGAGAGGFVETSGHLLNVNAATVETASGADAAGTWLLDPYDVTIASAGASGTVYSGGTNYTPAAASTILNTTIDTALNAGNNVTIETGSGGSSNGNITVNAAIAWTTGAGLTLNASGNILINAAITATGSVPGLHLLYGQGSASGASASYTIAAPVGLPSNAGFSTQRGSTGAPVTYTVITTQAQLQNIGTGLSGNYALGANITTTGNFTPIGASTNAQFAGKFEGLGNTISNLTINAPSIAGIGLFGNASNATIRDVGLLNENVTGNNDTGGLVGDLHGGVITASYATGVLAGNSYVGGLVGFSGNSTITGSYATAAVSGSGGDTGGLVGYNSNGTVTASYATGAVSATGGYGGGLVGGNSNGTIAGSYATGTVSGTSNIGGLVGTSSGGGINGSYSTGTVNGSVNIGGLVGYNSNGTITASYGTGAVTGTSGYVGGLVGNNTNGTISNAYATGAVTGDDYVGGLFGYNATGTITDTHATGVVSGNLQVGGLGGFSHNSSITGSYATGAVTGSGNDVGGLVGESSNSAISGSYANGAVSGFNNVGGLVGSNGGTITESYATGAVNGLSTNAGGLVGKSSNGTISNAYETGTVFGSNNLGGLVGLLKNGSITNVYATGTVTTGFTTGGLVGVNSNSTITDAYWDTVTTGQSSAVGSGSSNTMTPETTQALAASLPAGFLASVWTNSDGKTTPYLLADETFATVSGAVLLGNDTSVTPTVYRVITSQAQLQNINTTGLSSNYVLGNNIVATGDFTPIGSSNNTAFTGIFEGLGNTISNLTINEPNGTNVGLFGYASNATISDVGLVNETVTGLNSVGGLVGYLRGNNITNSYVQGTVSGSTSVGGLLGSNHGGTITDSYATATVSGSINVGGLVGSNDYGIISNAYAAGAVSGSTNVGGLVGAMAGYNSNGMVIDAYATGAVSGSINVGGLVGSTGSVTITDAYATGAVSGSTNVGGLVGSNNSTITDGYWDTATTGQPNGVGSASPNVSGVTGLATAQWLISGPIATATFSTNVWVSGYPYPVLKALPYIVVTGNSSQSYGAVSVTPSIASVLNQNGSNVANLVNTSNIVLISSATGTPNAGSVFQLGGGGVAAPSGYQLTYDGNDTITPAPLTITGLAGMNKSYNDSVSDTLTGAPVIGGLVGGQTVTLANYSAGTLASSNAGSEAVTTAITLGSGANGYIPANYVLVQPTLTVTVYPAALTITGLAGTGKTYDGTVSDTLTGAPSVIGLIGGQTVALANYTAGTLASPNAGSEAVTANVTLGSGANGYIAANYILVQPPLAAVTVSRATLTITGLAGAAKTYDGTTSVTLAGTPVFTGLVGGQTLNTIGTLASANAGSEAVTINLADGSNGGLASNYTLAQSNLAPVTISRATLTITGVTGAAKAYDGSTSVTLTGTPVFTGLVGGQTLNTIGTLASANAGSEAVTISLGNGSNGGLASNYVLAQPTLAAVTVSRATLTLTGLAGTPKTYDGTTTDALTGTPVFAGLVGGQTLNTTATLASANAGSEAVTISLGNGSNGGLASNYVLAQPNLAPVTISPAQLTITGLAGTDKTYDGTTSDTLTGTPMISGLIGGQTVTLANDTGTLASANAGTETMTADISFGSGANGWLAGNYVLIQPMLAAVTVSRAQLSITGGLSAANKTYDGTISVTLTGTPVFTGLIGGETLTTTGTLASANAGSQAVTISLADGSNGGLAANYVLNQPMFAAVTIVPASLTITGLAGTVKTYDGTTSDALTGTPSIIGLIGGQTVTLGNATSGTLAGAGPGSEAVTTDITLGDGANGWLAANYVLIQPALAAVEVLPAGQASPTVTTYLATAPAALAFGYLAQIATMQTGINAPAATAAAAATAATAHTLGGCGPNSAADSCKRLIIRQGGVKKPGPERAAGVGMLHTPARPAARQEAAAAIARSFD